MYKHLVIVVALSSLCCFLYGILHILWDVEKNACRMTYMYQLPTFIKIQVNGEEDFPKYNLFAYAEGRLIENARAMKFNGAPVIFVPGNSGSYKQGRSLASTALRKGMDHDLNHHLDYFLVDFNEEFSALYGEYLVNQAQYLNKCILTILKLYKHLPNGPKQVALIGHSMGGKVAQSLLLNETMSELINTIIFIATPVDRPVINIDFYLQSFYKTTNEFLQSNRKVIPFQNDTNSCTAPYWNVHSKSGEENKLLDDKLLISVGGGNRDFLVHSGLTYSKYSDINVMTSAIPNVWLSTDHVASVWCLQLVLVINRFLFSIISSPNNSPQRALSFVQDKAVRLSKASYYFVAPRANNKRRDVNLASDEKTDEWVQDSRRVFTKEFVDGLDHPYFQMIPLITDKQQYKKLHAEAVNLESEDWVFGCDAKEFKHNIRYCSTGYSISHHTEKLPSNHEKRMFVSIDLHKIKKTYPNWTHVLLRVLPTRSNIKLNIDIHDPDERTFSIKAPRWYSYSQKQLIADSTLGVSHFKILVSNLDESYQSIQFNIKPRVCSKPHHNAVAKSCIPWVMGFDRYQNFSETENNPLLLNVPISKPLGYNTSENPVTINLHLDPNCRYEILYQNSFAGTVSRIVQQYFHWLPAHLTAILLLSFKYQLSLTPSYSPFKCGKLHSAIVHCGSFFIITVTRIFSKLLLSVKVLPEPDNFHQSLLISFVIHGSASAILLLITAAIWTLVTFYANIVHSIFLRLTRLSSPVFSITLPIIERFPLLAGVVLISIALSSCGGIALILACFVYFMLITKKYEDFLEQFVFDTIAIIAKRLFGRDVPNKDDKCDAKSDNEEANKDESSVVKTSDDSVEEDSLLQLLENNLNGNNDIQTTNTTDLEEDVSNETQEQDKELERLLNEAIEKQKELLNEKEEKRKMERQEYDGIHEGLISVHFHMTLFLLLCVLTFLFIPTTLSWARDFRFSNRILSDPSIIPAVITIPCVFILCQFSAPRNLYAYNFVASILYVCAAICIIYCQDSVYRLSGIIPSVFVFVAAHQVFSPTKLDGNHIDPVEADIKNRIEKMKAVLTDAEANSKKTL